MTDPMERLRRIHERERAFDDRLRAAVQASAREERRFYWLVAVLSLVAFVVGVVLGCRL